LIDCLRRGDLGGGEGLAITGTTSGFASDSFPVCSTLPLAGGLLCRTVLDPSVDDGSGLYERSVSSAVGGLERFLLGVGDEEWRFGVEADIPDKVPYGLLVPSFVDLF